MEIFLIKAFQFLLSLSLIVLLHELGHFIPAKLFKTKVERFYLFFDVKFSIYKKKIGDTIYGINIAGTYEDYTHVSTGGGAFLQWLEGKDLPAVEAILNKH